MPNFAMKSCAKSATFYCLFKVFFSRNKNHLRSFLSAILGKDIRIKNVIHDARLEQLAKEMKRLAELRLMSKLEENSALATARAKGTEEGLRQGKEEGLKQR